MKKIFLLIMLWVLMVFAINAQDMSLGLTHHWPLNGDASDVIGSSAYLVDGAVLTSDRDGNTNSAYEFAPGVSKIDITGDFNIAQSGFTVSCWVYIEETQPVSTNGIIGFGDQAANGWTLVHTNWPEQLGMKLNTTSASVEYFAPMDQAHWHHLAFTYANGVTNLYLNGILYQTGSASYSNFTGDLIFGAREGSDSWGFAGKLDDVRIYDRVVTKTEINILAENYASFYSTFENQSLQPSSGATASSVDLFGGGTVTVVDNPEKDVRNSSDYALKTTTLDNVDQYSRAEYTTLWDDRMPIADRTHIYKWKVYFPEGYNDVDAIAFDWDVITQFVTAPCANYDNPNPDGYTYFGDEICGTGGIFNELRLDMDNPDSYGFTFRAEPNCDTIQYVFPKDQWVDIAMEVYYTTNFDGYYGVYINGALLGGESAVRTLPESFITDGTCDFVWKVGAYQNWDDAIKTERSYYIDDMELYIDKDIEDVCPECDDTPPSTYITISTSGTDGTPYVLSGITYNDKVIITGDYITLSTCTFNKGIQVSSSNVSITGSTFITASDTALIINEAEYFEAINNTFSGTGQIIHYTAPKFNKDSINVDYNNYQGVTNGKFNNDNWGVWQQNYKLDVNSVFR